MSVEYTKKTWYDGSEGGTPITAAELNRVETGIDDVVTQSNADKTNIDTHIAKKVNSSDGAHGLRYYNSELDYYDDTNEEWVEIQTGGGGTSDYEDLTNLPSVNGVELLGNKTIGLLSGNIQVDSDKIGYNNAISGLTATNVKAAIDELANSPVAKTNIEAVYEETTALSAHSVNEYIYMNNLLYRVTSAISIGDSIVVNTNVELADDIEEGTEAYISNLPGSNVPNYPDLTNKPSINGVELLGNKLVGLLSTDIHINADKIGYSGTVSGASTTKAAIDALQSSISGLHGIPSGGNTNQVLAKNSNSDYDLKWVNQTGGGGVGTVINLTTLYSALFNQTVTLTGTYDTYTTTFDSTGHATVNVFYVDTYAVTCQGSTDSVTVTAIGLVINADVFSVAVVNLTTPYSALFNQTVTLTGTNATYTSSFDASGHATFNVLYTDTYTVTCQSLTDSVTVSTLGTVVNATVFDITTVNITTSDSDLIGETISVYFGSDPTDVRASLTFDSNLSVSFQTEDIGTYNIVIGYSNPVSFTVSTFGDIVSVTYNPTPTGSSVTPVNNVRNWLDSAKVFDKNYTTISQVLSDTTTLQTLISSQNANDYLVRSTSWVSDVCGNSTAMSYIGLNNYSANTLLADSTWCTGICNSTYFESVLNVKVPTMTNHTTPSGLCFASSELTNYETGQSWRPFSGETENWWRTWSTNEEGSISNAFLGYVFNTTAKLYIAEFSQDNFVATGTYKIQTSTDTTTGKNGTWSDVLGAFTLNGKATTRKILSNQNALTKSARVFITSQTMTLSNAGCGRIFYCQFYGRQDI